MAVKDIIQNMISRLGQSQADRQPDELKPGFAPLDDRDAAALLAQARALAFRLNYYAGSPKTPRGEWSGFFPAVAMGAGGCTAEEIDAFARRDRGGLGQMAKLKLEALAASDHAALAKLAAGGDGETPPHLALLIAFLRLYRLPQSALNDLTARHLDFQMRRVLGFEPRPAQPDRAYLVLELKKGAAPVIATPAHRFTAGKDAKKIELLYAPVRETVIGQGRVASLRSIYRGPDGMLRVAPLANSADGLGTPLAAESPSWPPFGNAELKLPRASIGFAVASPLLRMKEGGRTVELHLDSLPGDMAENLANSFEAWLTGPKSWLGPFTLSCKPSGTGLALSLTLPASEQAVVDYDAKLHGHSFTACGPVLQCLLKESAPPGDSELAALPLGNMRLTVTVTGIKQLALENDAGALNPKRAFLPFGAEAAKGSRFMIGCEEALAKPLTRLDVSLSWLGAPADLQAWYAHYKNQQSLKNGATVSIEFRHRGGQADATGLTLMDRIAKADNKVSWTPATPKPPPLYFPQFTPYILNLAGGQSGKTRAFQQILFYPVLNFQWFIPFPLPAGRADAITLTLEQGFLHADYRKESLENAMAVVAAATVAALPDATDAEKQAARKPPVVLNEPYAPKVQAISLDYTAQSETVDVNSPTEESFSKLDIQFFHVGCFGQSREHKHLRMRRGLKGNDLTVKLLPAYPHAGELLIGLGGVAAGDGISLLLQADEGSADPSLKPPALEWSVLCDNVWRPLKPPALALDTTKHLRRSGLVAAILPPDTTTDNTLMPTGLAWLRATIGADPAAACKLVDVSANAIEVRLASAGNDPAHLATALPAGGIAKMAAPLAELKSVRQPAASFGGAPEETAAHLAMRAAERLRHRQRCSTPWDYERMVLEAFPEVYKAKCIPHASETSWLAPGNVLLVVLPDWRGRGASNPLRPGLDGDTLDRITEHAKRHAHLGLQMAVPKVGLSVRNPRYQEIACEFTLKLRPGFPFNEYRPKVNDALVRALSPWAFDAARRLEFGGKVYRSVLLDVVEALEWVDYVGEFKMRSGGGPDLAEASADTPDAVLTSAREHQITELKDA